MILALYIIGVVVIIVSVVTGFASRSFAGVLIGLAGGISSAAIFFALAKILENQESILYKLYHEEVTGKTLISKKVCPKCNYTYDSDYSSCPHCGNRD